LRVKLKIGAAIRSLSEADLLGDQGALLDV